MQLMRSILDTAPLLLLATAALTTPPALAQDRPVPTLPDGPGKPFEVKPERPAPAKPPSILAILAHPDDEITIAPVLARTAREGGEVTLVFATSGDAGPGVSGLEPGEELAALREDEGRCAAFALGIDQPIYWQMGDGKLSEMARTPGSAANDMVDRIASLIEIQQPQVIMTWGPDGGYGHADHRMVSNAVTQVVQAMAESRPSLLYAAFPATEGTILQGFEGWATISPDLVTDRIRYQLADLETTRAAIDCYQSQFDETARSYLPSILHQDVWQGTVHFRLAFPNPIERP